MGELALTTAATTTTTTTNKIASEIAKAKTEETASRKFTHLSSRILAALRQHLTTWRQKLTSSKEFSNNRNISSSIRATTSSIKRKKSKKFKIPSKQPRDTVYPISGKWFKKICHREEYSSNSLANSFVQRSKLQQKVSNSIINPSSFERALQQFSSLTFESKTEKRQPEGPGRFYGRKVEIVAKLLSLDLVEKKIGKFVKDIDILETPQQRRGSVDSGFLSIDASTSGCSDKIRLDFLENFKDLAKSFTLTLDTDKGFTSTPISSDTNTVDNMTITDLTFLDIRDENPDLDSEIRGILTARAQEGATISEIKDDYRKLTGMEFPIYERITDFLLTIPYVSAYCNENGTRIFNMRPMEKTKHIHEMVVNQKPAQEPITKPYKTNYRNYYRERQRNTNYYPSSWRLNSSYRLRNKILQEDNRQYYYQQEKQQQKQKQQQQQHQYPIEKEKDQGQQQQQQQEEMREYQQQFPVVEPQHNTVTVCNDKNIPLQTTEDFIKHNCCYNDNCNYLLKRICNPQNIVEPTVEPLPLQAIVPPTMYEWADQEEHNLQQQRQDHQQQQLPNIIEHNPSSPQDNEDNNAIPTCYDNNLNHLNNLYRKANNHTNNIVPRPRRSLNGPSKGFMISSSSRSRSPTVKSNSTNDSLFTDSDYEAHLLDFLLLGDDFLLFMARMELRCKFKKNQKVLQSGLCVSGQTISAAIRRISELNHSGRSIIVNIGSVNILQCRQLIQIEHEYRELIKVMLKKGIKPILTTLAPLANHTHNNELKVTLERFNEFIKREGKRMDLVVIDIWKCLVNAKGHVLFDCYQSEPRVVTGAKESYLFWNKIGRQRVLQMIESHLEY